MKSKLKKRILGGIIGVAIITLSCRMQKECLLQLMSNQEIFERIKSADFTDKNAPVFDKNNQLVPKDSLANHDSNKNGLAYYKDCSGKVVKKVIRPITEEDFLYRKKFNGLFKEDIDLYIKFIKFSEKDSIRQKQWMEMAYYEMPLKARNIDCDSIAILLSSALNQDQINRTSPAALQSSLQKDRQNQILVKSIIEKCNFEAIEKQGKEAVFAAFMITQHAQTEFRTEYYPYFENSAKKNLLKKAALALMIDRMLMEKGDKQMYGSQWETDPASGTNILTPLKYPKRINILRDSMGMQPLEEYMKSNNIKFAVEEKSNQVQEDWTKYSMPLKIRNIDCDSIPILLSGALKQDQENGRTSISLENDRQNQIILKSIVTKCGFPSIEKYGKDAIFVAFMITQHAMPALRTEYYPYFEKAAKKNLLKKAELARMIDRMLMEKGEPQLYGTQWLMDKESGQNTLYPLKYPKRIHILRDSMEMQTLEEHMKINNIIFK
jgi:hypothetical protein